jgi:hypothetical protein
LVLDVKLPPKHKLNPGSPQRFQARVEGKGLALSRTVVPTEQFALPLRVAFTSGKAGTRGVAVASTTIFYCIDEKGLCKIKSLRFRAPFEVAEGGATKLTLPAQLN